MTGVQTCALPIYALPGRAEFRHHLKVGHLAERQADQLAAEGLILDQDYALPFHAVLGRKGWGAAAGTATPLLPRWNRARPQTPLANAAARR